MRLPPVLLVAAALAALSAPARAEGPPPAASSASAPLGVFAGAAVFVAAFGAGGVLLGGDAGSASDNAGWLTVQSGFALAPLVSHGVTGEWGRGFALSALPAGALAGSATVMAAEPTSVRRGKLPLQRVLWACFGVGLFSSAVGVVDTAFSDERKGAFYVAPVVDAFASHFGVEVGGVL